jgi:hypothetical protein
MLSLLLLAPLAVAASQADSTYASPALERAIAAAAAANHRPPPTLHSYRSRIETEISLLVRDTLGREHTAEVEQLATAATWSRDGRYDFHIVGYRAQSIGVPYSALSIVRAWTVPSLYGERLRIGVYPAASRPGSDTIVAAHPFANDRDEFYRFTGGDTIAVLHSGTRDIPIVRVRVHPRLGAKAHLAAFDGEIDLDADRGQIVRMRGRFVIVGAPGTKREAIANRLGLVSVAYAEFVNAEIDGKYWLPAFQRTEFQASFPFFGQARPVIRLVSNITRIAVHETGAVSPDTSGALRVIVSWAPADSLREYKNWDHEIGTQSGSVHADDFDDLAPEIWRPTGPPRLNIFPQNTGRILRFNRVEGVFTGIAPSVDFRNVAPGLNVGVSAGWAWTEQTMRGGASVTYRRGQSTIGLRAERTLATTNDFGLPLGDDPGLGALLSSIDNYDYVDRRSAMLSATRVLGSVETGLATFQVGVASDHAEQARLAHGLISGGNSFIGNRGVAEGHYAIATADLELHPNVTGDFVQPGLGARAHYEGASGDLSWQRIELGLSARRYLGPVSIAAHADGGVVLGASPPPQTLFELGGNELLPGYSYKQFAGDRAALFRTFASYRFHIWERPVRVRRNFMLPAVSPGIAVSAQGGWTELSSPGAVRAVRQLGAGWSSTPVSEATRGVRATVGGGLTFFSDIVHIGVARPVDRAAPWKLVFGFGGAF